MSIRSDGDVVLACKLSADLTALIRGFLATWREHANGVNKVDVPSAYFSVVLLPPKKPGFVEFAIAYAQDHSWQEPQYRDVDDDYFVEGFGAGDANLIGHVTRWETHQHEKRYSVPTQLLFMGRDQQVAAVKKIAVDDAAAKKEAARQAELSRLQSEIDRLKTQGAAP